MNASYEGKFVDDYEPVAESRVELRNGRVVDVINGCYFDEGARIVVEGAKIEAVSRPGGESFGTAPHFIVDLQGKAVLPGLFNTHCHILMIMPSAVLGWRDMRLARKHRDRQMARNMAECLNHGVTTIRDAMTPDLRQIRELKKRIASGEMPGPRIRQSIVVGPPGSYLAEEATLQKRLTHRMVGMPFVDYEDPDSGVVLFPIDARETQVRDAVDRAVDERKADCIKIGEQIENMINFKPDASIMTLGQLKALTDQAARRGVKTTIHHVSVDSFRRAVEAGVNSFAHAAFDSLLTKADVEAFKRAGCISDPTATVAYDLCWKLEGDPLRDHPELEKLTRCRDKAWAKLADEYWIPELSACVKRAHDRITNGKFRSLGLFDMSGVYRYYSPVISRGIENVRMLFNEGACIASGNDGGVPVCTLGMIQHELAMLNMAVSAGAGGRSLTGLEAVRIASINSARALGLENQLGSIEPGKVADLVIVDGDPLKDFSVVGSRVAALFMDGRLKVNNCGLRIEKQSG